MSYRNLQTRNDYSPLRAPQNPRAVEAALAMAEYMRPLLANPTTPAPVEIATEQAAPIMEVVEQPAAPLYPLADPRPVWRVTAHDDGTAIVVDDPAGIGVEDEV